MEEISQTMEDFIIENHIDKLEDVVHKLAHSKGFLNQFIEDESILNGDIKKIKRKDIAIGDDLDVHIRHFTEHQSFTMVLVPISIYSLAVYDTILFSVLEVSDKWMERAFPYKDISNDSIKSALLSDKNHYLLGQHVYEQALKESNSSMGEVTLEFEENYVSSSTVHENLDSFSELEKTKVKHHWGLLKSAFSHSVGLNVEMNVYVFGYNDIVVSCKNNRGKSNFKVTPSNIFKRHHFKE